MFQHYLLRIILLDSISTDSVISKVQFFLSTFVFPLFAIDQNRLPTCSNFSQPMPAAAKISFNAFDQFHPTMAPQCNNNNYPWSHYCCTIFFIHTMHRWKKKLIEELEMELTELIAISSWQNQDIHMDFKAYASLKSGLILLVIYSTITILGRQRNLKMPSFFCVGIVVLFILFTIKIRPKLLIRQPLLPPLPPMPHPAFQTPL